MITAALIITMILGLASFAGLVCALRGKIDAAIKCIFAAAGLLIVMFMMFAVAVYLKHT